MRDTTSFPRRAAAACLVLAAVTSVVWVQLEPPFPEGYAARLAAIDAAGTSAMVSAWLFVWSQVPMLVAFLTIAHLSRRGAPRLAGIGGGFAALGAVGHLVWGGIMLVTVLMAGDAANREVYAGLLEKIESTPLLMIFAASGLIGTVLGVLLLAIGLWKSRAVPSWQPAVLLAFLVVEFVGTNFSEYAGYVGGLCLLIAFTGLAREVWHAPRDAATAAGTSAPVPA